MCTRARAGMCVCVLCGFTNYIMFSVPQKFKNILSSFLNKSTAGSGRLASRCVSLDSANVFTTAIFPRGVI